MLMNFLKYLLNHLLPALLMWLMVAFGAFTLGLAFYYSATNWGLHL